MPTLANRPHRALLVIDVQNGVFAQAHDREAVLASINTVIDKARAAGLPVIWIEDHAELPEGSDGWQLVPEVARREDEPLVKKAYGDAFEATDLEEQLTQRGVGSLVIVGGHTDACVRSTLHGALARGYDVTLVSDAHTTEDLTPWGLRRRPR